MQQLRLTRRRGLAILATLAVLTLLLALIAAFLTVNRAGNQFTLGSVERAAAQDACSAALDYARFRLEKERSWGAATPASGVDLYPFSSPVMRLEHVQTSNLLTINGVISSTGDFSNPQATFVMQVENNLQSRTSHKGVEGPVPPRSVRVAVNAKKGAVSRKLVAILRPVPITHDSLSAGRNINLEDTAGLVRIESRDSYINRIRAAKDLNLPTPDRVTFLKHGVATSFNQLNVGGIDLAEASDEDVRQAGEVSGGVYMPNPGKPAPVIKPFDASKIALPTNETTIPGGTWTFGEMTYVQYKPHHLTYQTPPPPGPGGGGPGTGHTTRYQRISSLYTKLRAPSGQEWVAGTAVEGSTVIDPPHDPLGLYPDAESAYSYGYGDTSDANPLPPGASDVATIAPGFRANVTTAQMVVWPQYRLRATGDFIVASEGSRLPELYFGYDLTTGGVATQTSMADGIEAAQNDPGKYMAAIIASGDVNVTGGVLGYGSMLADGTLTIKASSGLRAAPDLGVVVKGRRIIINPATEPEPGFPGEPVDADYPVFQTAIQSNTGGDWSAYNQWLEHDQTQRDTLLESLRLESTGSTAAALWNTLCTQINTTLPPPDFTSFGWPSGPITVDQYVRMKEFLQTRTAGYNNGNGDQSWLNLAQRQDDAKGRVASVLNGIAQWARSYRQTFQQYLMTPDQGPPDMFLAGLMYADEDFTVNANGKSVRLEGAVVARTGDISAEEPARVDLVYNRTLLDDISASNGTGPVKLEKVFVTID